MAIKRQFNFLGNQRVDVPHLRLIESAVAADFQSLSGVFMAGSQALIGSGVVLLDTGMVGQPSNTLVLRMANASLLHGAATEPGGIFTVPATQPDDTLNAANAAVVGSFAPNVTNYIAIDLVRTADPTKLQLLERSGSIRWQLTIKPGESKSLRYKYERFVPSS